MFGLFGNKEKDKELKRLQAIEQRLKDMQDKYNNLFLRGRSKTQVVAVMNDIDKVLGVKNNGL